MTDERKCSGCGEPFTEHLCLEDTCTWLQESRDYVKYMRSKLDAANRLLDNLTHQVGFKTRKIAALTEACEAAYEELYSYADAGRSNKAWHICEQIREALK